MIQIAASDIGTIDTVQKHTTGTLAYGSCYITAGSKTTGGQAYLTAPTSTSVRYDGNIYIYLLGVASTAVGDVVTYDEDGVTARGTNALVGQCALATAATVASTWGWYLISGTGIGNLATNCADNVALQTTATAGELDDTTVAGDDVWSAVSRVAVTTATTGLVQVNFPFMNQRTTI